MSFPYAGGRGQPAVVDQDPATLAAVAHTEGQPLEWLLILAGGHRDALETLLAMEGVRPGGSRPQVVAELERAIGALDDS